MKKSIVLLISLLFITAISALILKNLDDTEIYVSEQNSKINQVQLMLVVKNVQKQISNLFSSNKEQLQSVIDAQSGAYYPLQIENIQLVFKVEPYTKINLNKLNSKNKEEATQIISELNDLGVYNIDNLQYLLRGSEIESNKQLDNILDDFIKQTYDNKILEVKDLLGFFDGTENEIYELIIKLKFINEIINAYYILNKEGQVQYFELSFK